MDEETGIVTYMIDRMFSGAHTIMFVGTHTQPESFLVTFDDDDKFYTLRDGDLRAEEKDVMTEAVKSIVVESYTSAFAGNGADSLKALFAVKDGVGYGVDAVYASMLSSVNKEDGATLTSVDITNYSISFERYNFDGNVDVRFYYTAAYTAKEPRKIVDGVVIDGVRQSYEGTVDSEAIITFEYIDGKWQAVALDMKCIDYSKPEEAE